MFNSNEEIQIIGIDLGDNLDMKNQYIINEELTRLNEKFTLKSRYENAIKEIERLKKYEKEALDTLENTVYENINLTNEVDRLNNIINKLEWKPIDEYFKNKENYDWVLIKYYDKNNFECIPSVAEYRCGKWYLKDNDEPLQDFDIRYFFDMQQLDKLKALKEGK